jgi:pimeloyl-ACP methyl ester carboxylesterase
MNDMWEERFIERPWGRMVYKVRAGEGVPLMLIHGALCDAPDWDDVATHLPAIPLIVPTLAGHGSSDTPNREITFDNHVEDLAAIVGMCSATDSSKVVLGGHSLGGMLSFRFMTRFPDLVLGAALVEGWTRLANPWARRVGMFGALDGNIVSEIQRRNDATLARWPEGWYERYWKTVATADAWEFLCATERPLVEIFADRGEPRPDRNELAVPDKSNIELAWIPGAGHYAMHERPDLVGRVIADWLIRSGFA